MATRLVSFAGSSVAIDYHGPRPAHLVDFLYRHIPSQLDLPRRATYRLQPAAETAAGLTLSRGETLLRTTPDEAALAELLLGDSCYQLTSHSRGGLLFHAAALAWQGVGLMLPGASGVGKTTLTAWLLGQGFDYLTDELVFIPAGDTHLQTFTRPLNLKADVAPSVTAGLGLPTQPDLALTGPRTLLLAPELLGAGLREVDPSLDLVIFPRYRPDGPLEWRFLSKARAGLALMEMLINARNLTDHGFSQISRLSRQVPAFQMTYASFEQVASHLLTIRAALSHVRPAALP